MLLKLTITEPEKNLWATNLFHGGRHLDGLGPSLPFKRKKTKRCDLKGSSQSNLAFSGDLRSVKLLAKYVRFKTNGDLDCGPPLHSLVSKAACGVAASGTNRLSSVV